MSAWRLHRLRGGYFGGNGIVRRILQTGVEVGRIRQVEQSAHLLARRVLERRGWMIGGVRDSPLPGWYPPWTQVVSMCVIVLSFALETAWRAWDACVMLT